MPKHAQLLAVAIGVALTTAMTASGSTTLSGPGTIRVTSTVEKHTYVDLGKKGPSAGDVDFYRELIYNKRITSRPIGHSDVTCTSTGSGSSNCNGTYLMPKGKIVVGGVIGSHRAYVLAVLGGTGLYDNVRGSLTVHPLTKSEAEALFKLGV
jgi:hypothetical protein